MLDKTTHYNSDGLNAYDILSMPECPYSLPAARYMTQAAIDFYSMQDGILKWYEENKEKLNLQHGKR